MIPTTSNWFCLAKYQSAVDWCNKALELDPKSIDAYAQRSQCYMLWRKEDLAQEDFKKAELLKREKLWSRQHVPK